MHQESQILGQGFIGVYFTEGSLSISDYFEDLILALGGLLLQSFVQHFDYFEVQSCTFIEESDTKFVTEVACSHSHSSVCHPVGM